MKRHSDFYIVVSEFVRYRAIFGKFVIIIEAFNVELDGLSPLACDMVNDAYDSDSIFVCFCSNLFLHHNNSAGRNRFFYINNSLI